MKTARQQIEEAAPGCVYELDAAKAAKRGGRTMLVPSPLQIREAIAAIPKGVSMTMDALRADLARANGAEVTCPRAATIGWFLVAEAADEDASDATPWWRVTRAGKPEPRLPGGAERHRALLAEETLD